MANSLLLPHQVLSLYVTNEYPRLELGFGRRLEADGPLGLSKIAGNCCCNF